MPAKETRKVFAVGGSKGITLPKPYADYHKIEEGDEVEVLYDSLILIIPKSAQKKFESRQAEITKLLE